MLAVTKLLSRRNILCLSRQAHFCRDKTYDFVTVKRAFCRDKNKLVATKVLSPQNYVCRAESEANNPPCWRVQLLSRRLLGKKERAGF